jgi:hypothetical protein
MAKIHWEYELLYHPTMIVAIRTRMNGIGREIHIGNFLATRLARAKMFLYGAPGC